MRNERKGWCWCWCGRGMSLLQGKKPEFKSASRHVLQTKIYEFADMQLCLEFCIPLIQNSFKRIPSSAARQNWFNFGKSAKSLQGQPSLKRASLRFETLEVWWEKGKGKKVQCSHPSSPSILHDDDDTETLNLEVWALPLIFSYASSSTLCTAESLGGWVGRVSD